MGKERESERVNKYKWGELRNKEKKKRAWGIVNKRWRRDKIRGVSFYWWVKYLILGRFSAAELTTVIRKASEIGMNYC